MGKSMKEKIFKAKNKFTKHFVKIPAGNLAVRLEDNKCTVSYIECDDEGKIVYALDLTNKQELPADQFEKLSKVSDVLHVSFDKVNYNENNPIIQYGREHFKDDFDFKYFASNFVDISKAIYEYDYINEDQGTIVRFVDRDYVTHRLSEVERTENCLNMFLHRKTQENTQEL